MYGSNRIIAEIKDYDYFKIVRDNITGVLYIVAEGRGAHGGGIAITPMLDRDGTPRTYRHDNENSPMIEKIADYDHYEVIRDTTTDILYLVAEGRGAHGGGIAITPMINTNGAPRTNGL